MSHWWDRFTGERALALWAGLFAFFMAPAISIAYFCLGFLALTTMVVWARQRRWPKLQDLPLLWPLALYAAWGLVSSFCGIGPDRSLRYWRSDLLCLAFWLFYWLFDQEPRVRRWATRGFTLSVALLALSGLFQFIVINWAPSINEWLSGSSIAWVKKFAMLSQHGGRVHGPMHTMTYAEVMSLSGLFVIGFMYRRRWLGMTLGVLSLAALLASGTRGPTLGFVAGVFVIGLGYSWFYRKIAWKVILPLSVSCMVLLFSPFVWARLRTAFEPESNRDRLVMWRVGARIIRDYPITGVGVAHIRTSWPSYFEKEWTVYLPYGQEVWSDVHSLYLQQAGERGIPGLLILVVLFGSMTWRCVKNLLADDRHRDLHLSTLAVIIGFWFVNLTESAFQDTEVVFVLYFILALAWSLVASKKSVPEGSSNV